MNSMLARWCLTLLAGLAVLPRLCAAADAALAAREPFVILTSYPEEVVATFERAFERRHPELALRILWRQHRDAYDYLQGPGQGGVDVYWAPAVRNFADLAREGALRKLDIDRAGLPEKVGQFRISDPQGYFIATEIAGFGFMSAPAYLRQIGVPPPRTWRDLANPAYQGHILFPVPSQVGFAPTLLDVILQAEGWNGGWAILSEAAGNFVFAQSGAAFGSLAQGLHAPLGVAVTIDFFANAAIANGAPLVFAYPPGTGYSPAHVAIMRDARHVDAARAFVTFVLSDEGQRLLFEPDLRKLPVRPSVYRFQPTDGVLPAFNPFAAARTAPVTYEETLGLERFALDNALFDVFVTRRAAQLAQVWAQVHAAERQTGTPGARCAAQARARLSAPPIDAAKGADASLRALFDRRKQDPAAAAQADRLEAAWAADLDRRTAEALRLLQAPACGQSAT